MIEGRAAGKDKGMELWEEVGYYKGFAALLRAAYDNDHGSSYVFDVRVVAVTDLHIVFVFVLLLDALSTISPPSCPRLIDFRW